MRLCESFVGTEYRTFPRIGLDTDLPVVYSVSMTTTQLPTLYKKTSTGATQMWQIEVEDSTIVTTYGQVEGKLQVSRDVITEGKNIGRSNETSPAEQALSEAQSQWEKKLKNKGYVQTIEAAVAGESDAAFVAGGIVPMLAHSFDKQGHKITYPAFTQPKLDGHRCIAMVTDGVVTLWTRSRKPITGVPHIVTALEAMDLPDGTVLDGELYNHDYRDRFEELTSFIKRPKPKPGHEVVQYHVYDMVTDRSFSLRHVDLLALQRALPEQSPIVVVDTILVADEAGAMEAFNNYIEQGYEGSMLRNADSLYVNKRSYDLQKVKSQLDDEWVVVDVESGRGKMDGLAIFVCALPSGRTFRVKMKGALADLRKYVDDPSLAVGRELTVQYQNFTADGVPRFPIGLRFRDAL
jgi:DNA ligase-1